MYLNEDSVKEINNLRQNLQLSNYDSYFISSVLSTMTIPQTEPSIWQRKQKEPAMACTENPISQMSRSWSLHQLNESCSCDNRYPFNLSSSYRHRYLCLPGGRGGGMRCSVLQFYDCMIHSTMSQLGEQQPSLFPTLPSPHLVLLVADRQSMLCI